jgi:hypothetical protein
VNTARGLAKSYGERLRGCNVRNMNPEKAEGLSPELQAALAPKIRIVFARAATWAARGAAHSGAVWGGL